MKKVLRVIYVRQDGFTLLEVLLVLAITGFVGAGAAMTVGQVVPQNQRAGERVQAIAQVENAAYWIGLDALMAQTVTIGPGSGFPLTLSWQSPSGDINQVTYAAAGGGMQRSLSVNAGAPVQTILAPNINFDATETNGSYAANGVLTFRITSQIGTSRETRIYQVKLRTDQPSS